MTNIAVITGAASGIGGSTKDRVLATGGKVLGIDMAGAQEHEDLAWIQGDVADPDTWKKVSDKLGALGWQPDALVTAAAFLAVGNVLELTDDEWSKTLGVNLNGLVLAARTILPGMIERKCGSVVTIGSIDSYMAEQGLISYCASKGAILQFTRALALDHARDGVRANCVCPGVTDTPFFRRHLDTASDPQKFLATREQRNPLGRLLQPDEIAATVEFLIGAGASGITGTEIVVDAGLTTGFDFRTGGEGA